MNYAQPLSSARAPPNPSTPAPLTSQFGLERSHWRRELVRLAAVEKFEQRVPVAQIAAELRVTERSVQRWWQAWEAGGAAGLASKGQSARYRLSDGELAELDRVLDAGLVASGWEDQRWTPDPRPGPDRAEAPDAVHDPRDLVPAAAAPGLILPAGRPPRRRAGRRRRRDLEEGDLAAGKRTAAVLGAWIVLEDETGQTLRPPAPGPGAGAPPGTPPPRSPPKPMPPAWKAVAAPGPTRASAT
jgi:hypothetical protein